MTGSPPSSISRGYPLGLPGTTALTRYAGGTASGEPLSGTFEVGDFVIAQDGAIFICTAAGTPGTWAELAAGGGGDPDVQTFTADDTWTKPAGKTIAFVTIIAGGDGGYSGSIGGTGGDPGVGGRGTTYGPILLAALPATVDVTVGAGGAGGTGDGGGGDSGGPSLFGTYLNAFGTGNNPLIAGTGGTGGAGDANGTAGGSMETNALGGFYTGGGGGAKGSIGADGTDGGGGTALTGLFVTTGGGGGGGGGTTELSGGTGGTGGDGGYPGGGGGGGGATFVLGTTGDGGDGAAGVVQVVCI